VHVARAVHATAQAVWDVRRLLSWIRSQEPDSSIGLNSISLGGYVTSLVASLEDGLTCANPGRGDRAFPFVDLAAIPDSDIANEALRRAIVGRKTLLGG
jgi:hypothetical protein